MKKILLFIAGVIALMVLVANIGPLILLGVSVWLLYLVLKQFLQTDSTSAKIGWAILGLVIVSFSFSNIYAVIGIAAAYILYVVVKKWNNEEDDPVKDDPFVNFEEQWNEFKL